MRRKLSLIIQERDIASWIVILISIIFWIRISLIIPKLRPIADEVCALSNWGSNEYFPQFSLNPRLLSSLFTWASSILWRINYPLTITIHLVLLSVGIFLLFSRFSKSKNLRSSRIQSLLAVMFLTPWVILLLPPNPTAIYDTFFWFGGTWHALGAIYTILLMLKFREKQIKVSHKFLIIIVLSTWSEISAISMLIMISYYLLRSSEREKYSLIYLFLPATSILSHFLKSQSSGRLDAIHTGNLVLDLIKMFLITMKFSAQWAFFGILLGIILARVNSGSQQHPGRAELETLPSVNPILLSIGIGTIGISTIGYPSWRSTFIIGVAATIYSWQYFSRYLSNRNGLSQILRVLSIFLLLGLGVGSGQTVQQATISRAIWWDSTQTSTKESVEILKLSEEQRSALPADFGFGDWVNICFTDYWSKSKT